MEARIPCGLHFHPLFYTGRLASKVGLDLLDWFSGFFGPRIEICIVLFAFFIIVVRR
jgi:hypothetical protein